MSRVIDGAPHSNANAALAGLRPRRQASRRNNAHSATITTAPAMIPSGRKLNCGSFRPPSVVGLIPFIRKRNLIPPACRSVVGAPGGPSRLVVHHTNPKPTLANRKTRDDHGGRHRPPLHIPIAAAVLIQIVAQHRRSADCGSSTPQTCYLLRLAFTARVAAEDSGSTR